MPVHPTDAAADGLGVHGLRFLNDEWNDSISNGDSFTLRWNQSLAKPGSGLGVFKVTYPKDGVVVYELVSNLTDSIDGDSCKWTPSSLEKKSLYAMWLTAGSQNTNTNWTLSPPWTPKESSGKGSPWAAPFIIPVICLLGVYAACLSGYLVYRRRKKAIREQEDATPHQDAPRSSSVDSDTTLQAMPDVEGGPEKRTNVVLAYSNNDEPDLTITGPIDRSEIGRAVTLAQHGCSGTIERRGSSSAPADPLDIDHHRSNAARRGRSGTAEGRRPSVVERYDIEHVQSSSRRDRSGTAEGRRPSGIDRYDIERFHGSARRERSGTTEARRPSHGTDRYDVERYYSSARHERSGASEGRGHSTHRYDIDQVQCNVRRGRSGTTSRRRPSDSADRSDAELVLGSVRRGRSGAAERRDRSGGHYDGHDIELALSNYRRGRNDMAERPGIRLVPESAFGANGVIYDDDERISSGEDRAREVHAVHEIRDTHRTVKSTTQRNVV